MSLYVCPTDESVQCLWEGSAEDIPEHFILEHENLLHHCNDIDVDLEIASENRLLFIDEEIYLVQRKIEEGLLKIGLRYLGPSRIASNISYDIVLTADNEKYFSNFSTSELSVIRIADSFFLVDLYVLKKHHPNLKVVQIEFNISFSKETVDGNCENNDNSSEDRQTVIDDNDIEIILRDVMKNTEDNDADNLLDSGFTENSGRICRRYSSFWGLPLGLFDENGFKDISCSNCNIDMLPPIYLCTNNHNVCADCKHESCKICLDLVTECRNKDLEDYSRKCQHSCRYNSEGCTETFMYNEIRNHEMKCTFCIYHCVSECSFRGKLYEFNSHLKIKHPSSKVYYSTTVSFPKDTEFFVCDNKLGIFHCTSESTRDSIRWIVVYLGPTDRNFFCELTFKGARIKDALFLKRLEQKYSVAQSKDELKRMRAKDKNAVLTMTSYFQ